MRSFSAALPALAVLLALGGCSPHARSPTPDEQLRAIYSSEWKWRTEQLADNEDGNRPLADHLPKVDPATQEMRLKYWQDVLRRVDAISRTSLSAPEQVNYDVYRAQIEVLIASQRFRDFEMPANSDTTFWTDLGYTARRPFRTLTGLRALARADARHPALLPRTDRRDARRHAPRLHPAAGHHGGARRLHHRGHRGDPGSEPVLYPVPGHAVRSCRATRRSCVRRPSASSARSCSRRTRSC